MSGEQSYFQLHWRPTANTREKSRGIGAPWGKVPDTLGLLGEARHTDQDSGVPAGLLGNLTHQVQSPECLQCIKQLLATALSLEWNWREESFWFNACDWSKLASTSGRVYKHFLLPTLLKPPSTRAPSPARKSWCSCHYRASHHLCCHPSLRSPGSQISGAVNVWILIPRVPRLQPCQQPKPDIHMTASTDENTVARLLFVLL